MRVNRHGCIGACRNVGYTNRNRARESGANCVDSMKIRNGTSVGTVGSVFCTCASVVVWWVDGGVLVWLSVVVIVEGLPESSLLAASGVAAPVDSLDREQQLPLPTILQ